MAKYKANRREIKLKAIKNRNFNRDRMITTGKEYTAVLFEDVDPLYYPGGCLTPQEASDQCYHILENDMGETMNHTKDLFIEI